MFAPGEQELENLKAAVFELKAALTWERTQKVRLLEELGRYHGEIKRLQDRLTDLELQLAEGKHASAPSGSAMAEQVGTEPRISICPGWAVSPESPSLFGPRPIIARA